MHRPVSIASLSILRENQSGFLDYAAVDALGVAPSPTPPTPSPVAPVVPGDGVTANYIATKFGVTATSSVSTQLAVSTVIPCLILIHSVGVRSCRRIAQGLKNADILRPSEVFSRCHVNK